MDTEMMLGEKINYLKKWFKENQKLPEEIDMTLLKRFFKCMSYDIEETKQLLEINYELRNKSAHLFINRDPEDELTKKAYDTLDVVSIPGLTPENCKIVCFRLRDTDIKAQNSTEECKVFFMMSDLRFIFADLADNFETFAEDDIDIDDLASGEIHIVDIGNYSLRHILSLSLWTLRTYMNFLQQAYPVRLKAMHIINCPSYLNSMVAICRPFINDDVFNMIQFHTNGNDSLYDQVPRDMLPSDYGGKADSLADMKLKWWNILIRKKDYLVSPKYWTVAKTESRSKFTWW